MNLGAIDIDLDCVQGNICRHLNTNLTTCDMQSQLDNGLYK